MSLRIRGKLVIRPISETHPIPSIKSCSYDIIPLYTTQQYIIRGIWKSVALSAVAFEAITVVQERSSRVQALLQMIAIFCAVLDPVKILLHTLPLTFGVLVTIYRNFPTSLWWQTPFGTKRPAVSSTTGRPLPTLRPWSLVSSVMTGSLGPRLRCV